MIDRYDLKMHAKKVDCSLISLFQRFANLFLKLYYLSETFLCYLNISFNMKYLNEFLSHYKECHEIYR